MGDYLDYLLVAGGLVGLYFGAEWLLRGAIAVAQKLAIPTLIVSLVIVGFGTSMPELLVSVRAALSGSSDIALGNVVGSNTANILLIIGKGNERWIKDHRKHVPFDGDDHVVERMFGL